MTWTKETSCGQEARKIIPFVVPYTRGQGLDLGCGDSKVLPHLMGMDNGGIYGPKGVDITGDIRDLSMFADRSLNTVFSSHALEDLEDTEAALTEWWRVLAENGCLTLYLPHKELYPNIGQPGANPNHKHDFMPEDILGFMRAVAKKAGTGCQVLEDETRGADEEYSFLQVFQKVPAAKGWIYKPWRRQPNSTLIIRYGGFGDMAPVASAMALLKSERQRHITLNTTPRGLDAINGNPHIDAVWLQDTDQVPNPHLGDYWRRLATRFDEVLNLSGSVEDSLLATEGRVEHDWPLQARQKILGSVNYYEKTHDICGVSHVFDPQFYPTAEEAKWARKKKLKLGTATVMFVLQGSSVHKVWPHLDKVVARLLLQTRCHIVLVGDKVCQVLERGWEKEPRVWRRSGVWSIRETLAFARQCDAVVGPETGVLNFVSAMPTVRKVCILSHSSHENLTKHWRNTVALQSQVPCAPCHRMHYSYKHCPKHPIERAAVCATAVGPDPVFNAIVKKDVEGALLVMAPFYEPPADPPQLLAAE